MIELNERIEKKAKILIVEDEAIVAKDIELCVRKMGYEVVGHAATARDSIKKALIHKPDLILMDIILKGDEDGIDAANKIKEKMDIPVIFLTAYSNINLIDKAKIVEPYAYIVKPFQEKQLRAAIEMAIYKKFVDDVKKEQYMVYNPHLIASK